MSFRRDRFDESELTHDAFLGGRLVIAQPRSGYRAGVDPVLLAASVPALSGQAVLELGCGGGVASLCLARRVDGVELCGVEVQSAYADLAGRNALRNSLEMSVYVCDLAQLPKDVVQQQFDHVIANPPYYDRARGTRANDPGREAGLGEVLALDSWVEVASRRLKPKGLATFIQDARRLPELLGAMERHLGSLEVQPIAPRGGRGSHLVIVRGKKSGRADFRLHAPIVMHAGDRHSGNGKDYKPLIDAVLREAAPLPFGEAA